ncbi:unnamed protein product [Knipowitschia caucasica]
MSVCGLSMARRWSLLPRSLALWHSAALHTHTAQWNSNRSSVVRCGRQRYERSFPVLLLRPDGSTVHVRYKEPRRVLLMPVDVSTLSEEERRARQRRREVKKSPTRSPAEEDYQQAFTPHQYTRFWKNT